MTAFPLARPGSRELVSAMRFDDFEVSWAGSCLRHDIFTFGSEDGRILFADSQGIEQNKPVIVAPSREAINGVAFLEQWMCASTRNEIMLWTPPRKAGESSTGAHIPTGAHGVIAGHSGYLLAPLGRAGFLSCRPRTGPEQTVTVSSAPYEEAYFYRMMSLQASDGQEIVASAARRGGVAAMVFRGEDQKHILSTFTFNGLDVVDLCPLGNGTAPEAAAALGRDGTLILFRDVLRDRQPGTVKYQSVKGTAYRLLSARGYLFLLTSEALYVIAGLVDRFLNAAEDSATPVLVIPMEAVDAGLGGDRWLWIVMPDGVLRLDVELLDHISPAGLGERGELKEQIPTIITPDWRERQVEQNSRALASAV